MHDLSFMYSMNWQFVVFLDYFSGQSELEICQQNIPGCFHNTDHL
jgi:hypothetical protein